ncbi:GNAT family N-acetyltransferase [Rothia halotolerans]|uniref:GNAT family N-acetyltransferase n=1 Tax=Rothia halotolerans TaxID=405770 RepID=UPI001EDF3B06|nr:GNAT family N-acetyltransferase [Rothia halotolerans]
MNEYQLRPWREGDDLQLMQLWPDAENVHASVFRAKLGEEPASHWQRTFVVEHHGVPVAAGTAYETSLHSCRLWAYVEVAPDHRRRGLGGMILAALREAAAQTPSGVSALRSKVVPGSSGAGFAQWAGLTSIQRTRMVRIEAGALPPRPLREDEAGRTTQAVEDLATGSLELTRVLWDFYRRVHDWDPPAEQSLGQVNRLFLSDEAEAYGAVVLREDVVRAEREERRAPIAAFAVSYRPLDADAPDREVADDEATEVLLGYDVDAQGASDALQQLIALLVHQYPIVIEVDDSMEALARIAEALVHRGTAGVEEETLVVAEEGPAAA